MNIHKRGKKITNTELDILSEFIKQKDINFKRIVRDRESHLKGINNIDFILNIKNFNLFLSDLIKFLSQFEKVDKPKLKGNWYKLDIGSYSFSFYDNKKFRGINVKF